MTTIPSGLVFGKGHYQLTTVHDEKGNPIPRGTLSGPRLRELLDKPTGNLNYVTQAALMRAGFQTRELLQQWDEYNETIKTLKIPQDQCVLVQTISQDNKTSYCVPLQDFEVQLARSEMDPSDYFWLGLTDENGTICVHILFHQGEICIVSSGSIHVTNQDNTIKSLSIYALEDVVIDGSLDIEQSFNVYCSTLAFNAKGPVKTGGINFLCCDQCSISEQSIISTKDCLIRAGFLNHKGHIDSTSTSCIAELIEVSGIVTATEKNGISLVSLGLYTSEQSHLHAGKINIMTGAPVKQVSHPLLGKARLHGLISSKGLTVFSNDLAFEKLAVYVQGNITLFANQTLKIAESAKLFFNGEFIYQQSLFAAWVEGSVVQCPELEIFHKRIIISSVHLNNEHELRLNLPRVLIHQPAEAPDPEAIVFLPAFKNQADHFYKPYDKSQFTAFEVDQPKTTTHAIAKILFSATDYLSMKADFSLTSAEMTVQGTYVDCSSHIGNTSTFGLVGLALKSQQLHLSHAEFDNQNVGHYQLESKEAEIRGSYVNAETISAKTSNLVFKKDERDTTLQARQQVYLKSDNDSRIEKSARLVLRSPQSVHWECKNFYLRGTLDFEQLSIKAERLIHLFRADIEGQSLNVDTNYFFSFLSAFSVKKSLSIRSIVSLIALCDISSDLYTNTSIANFSCAFYRPASLSLNGKSLLSCSLAATNTLISILQLVLHDPTAQLALTLIRVGINAGPALYQAVQLSKALHAAATKQSPLERGEIITLLNQSKALLLSMGSMVYTGVGIANPVMHADSLPLTEMSVPSWIDIVKDINNVAAPLLGLAFGKRSDNLLSLDADLVFCTSDTNFSLFRMQAGWEFSPISSGSYVAILQPNPWSFDLSPVMSTSTSLWSMSASQEAILPVGLHSERTLDKTYVSSGLPSLSHRLSLTTQQLHFIGENRHSFSNSSIQTDSVDVENRNVVALDGSTWQVTNSNSNQGEVVLTNSQVTAKQWHNGSTGVFLAINSGITLGEVLDAPGAATQIVASSFHVDHWQEQGKFAADASQIASKEAHFELGAKVGSRASDWNIKQLDTAVKVSVDFKGSYYGPDHQLHSSSNLSNPTNPKETASEGFEYVDNAKPTVNLMQGGGVQYNFNAPVEIKGELVSVLPLAVQAPQFTVHDANICSAFSLRGNATFDHAQMRVSGSLTAEGGKMLVDGGEIGSGGSITITGEKTTVVDGAKLIANGDIIVESDNELISIGKVKTTIATETQKKWFGLSKTTHTDTSSEFTNNSFVSVNGNVELNAGSTMTVTGNDIWGTSILFHSKDKMAISSLLGAETSDKTHSNLFHKNAYEHVDETASASHLSAKDKISFSTISGNIENTGGELHAPNGVTMTVPKASQVINAAVILNSYYTESHRGLYFKTIAPLTLQQYIDQLPLVQNVGDLAKNHDLSSAITVSVDVINSSQKELSSLQSVGVVDTLVNNFLPEIGLSVRLGKTQTRAQDQRQGPGSITTGFFIIQGGEAVFLNNPTMHIASTDLRVNSVKVIGAALTSSVTVLDNALACTYSPLSSQTSFALNHADLGSYQRTWKGDLDLGNLSLQAEKMFVCGSQLSVKRMEGHVNQLEADLGTNASSHSGHQFSLSTSGSFSYSQDKGCTETAAFSKLFKGENNEAFDASQFSVDTLATHGDTCAEITAAHRTYEPIVESNKGHSFSLSGSLSDLKKDTNPTSVFSTWNVHASHVDKVNSDEALLRNSSGHLGLVAPLYHASAGSQFLNTLHGLFKPEPMMASPSKPKEAKRTENISYKEETPMDMGTRYQDSQGLDPAVVFSWDPNDDHVSSELEQQIDKNFADLIPKTDVLTAEAPASVEGETVVSPLLRTAFNFFKTELTTEDTPPRDYITTHTNFGVFVEVAIEDIERMSDLNHSFQTLLRSPEMDIYLSEMQHFYGAEAAFNGFVEKILNPFCEHLFDKSSYLYPMYSQLDGNHFLTREVFEEIDVPSMVERIGQNIDTRIQYFENLTKSLRYFYLFNIGLEDLYQISQGRPVLPLIKEEAYSTIGAVGLASFAQELSPYFTDATYGFSKLISGNELPYFLKALNFSWKYACPITGMFIGGVLGEYVAEKDEHNNLDIPLSFGMARQLWDAAQVRERIGAEFKEYVVPSYGSRYLSEHSSAHYYDFMKQLSEGSNLIGRSLMKPIPEHFFDFSQIADKFPCSLAEKFGKEITEKTFNEYAAFELHNKYNPVNNVDGDFFRDLIDKHSDFSIHTINKFKMMARSLFAVAAAETIVKLANAENKIEAAAKIALSYGAAEAGASVALTAGSALCASNPLCLAGVGLFGGIGGAMLAEDGWEQMQEDAHSNPTQQLPSFKNLAAFFKPSEFLEEGTVHSQSLRKGQ